MSFISIEYIFSDWIFIWFIIYYTIINTFQNNEKHFIEKHFSPILAMHFALFQNIFSFIYLIIKNAKLNIIIKYFMMMTCEKIIPTILLLQNKNSLHFQENIPVTIGLFGIYLLFLYNKNIDFFQMYKRILNSIVMDDNNTPFFWFIHKYLGL